ncbi:MAG: YkgJ family cysteine cluster protein [Pseudomonadota bacterium]
MKLPLKNWTKFKPSLCRSCFATCCHDMPLEVSVADLVRLELVEEEEAAQGLKPIATRLKKQKIIQTFHPKKMVFVIAQKKNKDCIFLDENRRCTVYSKRPEICRQFPKIGPKPGSCPYIPYSHEKS